MYIQDRTAKESSAAVRLLETEYAGRQAGCVYIDDVAAAGLARMTYNNALIVTEGGFLQAVCEGRCSRTTRTPSLCADAIGS